MKILHLSDSVLHPTGYANQSRLLCQTLQNAGNQVFTLGHNHHGMPIRNWEFEDGTKQTYTLLPSDGSPYARNAVNEYFARYKPEIFGILLDTFMLMQAQITDWQIPAKSYFWYPSDGGWFPKFCEQVLKKIDYPVAMAKFGQDQAKRLFDINAHYIPHGVKTQFFYPFSPEQKLQNRLKYSSGALHAFKNNQFFPLNIDLTNKFILGCVSRNQGRKNLPETIKAFCEFAKDKEDVLLVFHSDPVDNAAVCDLQALADRWGQGHKVLWTGMRIHNPYPDSRMRELYNLFDVFFLTTSGEGFGIPFVESMACGVPVLATDFTTTKELITDNDAGLGIKLMGENERCYPAEEKLRNGTITGTWEVDRGFADFYDSVDKLNKMYNDVQLRKKLGMNARNAAVKHYDWDNVVGKNWCKFLEEIHERP